MSAALAFTAFVCVAGVSAAPPPISIVTGLDQGWPDVRGYDTVGAQVSTLAPWGGSPFEFSPYPTYQSGVRVAVGDFNGDGRNEIVTAPAAGAFTELRMFDGRTFRQLSSFLPFKNAAWFNGAYLAAGDTNGDGRQEVVEGLDAGCCTTVHVLDVVAEDVEEEHVPEDVHPARVHEHRRERPFGPRHVVACRAETRAADRAGIERVVVDAPRARAELPEPDREVRRDQRVRDHGNPAGGDVVEERQHRFDPMASPT
jgi:hypothetical protein